MQKIASALFSAEKNGKSVIRFTKAQPDFTLANGYEVQKHLLKKHLQDGARLVGRKMGMTSRPKMQQMGIDSPIHGFLTDRMQVPEGGVLKLGNRIHPKVEPEIAFLLGRDLHGDVSVHEASLAISAVAGALEIIDSRYENFDFGLPDVVADNCSSSGFVIGPWRRPLDVSNLGIVLEQNGRPAQFGSSAAILGNPLRALTALVGLLGETLPAGTVILAGAATAAIPLQAGDWIRASFEKLGTVEVRIAAGTV